VLLESFIYEAEDSKLPEKNRVFRLNPITKQTQAIEQDLFDMISNSYAGIGGNAKINSVAGVNQYPVWDTADVDDDPEPDFIRMSEPSPATGGLKGTVSATDGTPAGKAALFSYLKKFFSTKGNWAEVSGAMANIAIKKLGVPVVSDENTVRRLLGSKADTLEWTGENSEGEFPGVHGWYRRIIGSDYHEKIIVGNI